MAREHGFVLPQQIACHPANNGKVPGGMIPPDPAAILIARKGFHAGNKAAGANFPLRHP
ncbi:MAG: hypothetical protein VB108_05280 [Anaerolineaceae bacterium]|nr:hypothetical protein [Anaerolineaceae bacterium]